MVGISVPGKLCKIKDSHQLAIGVNASFILSSNPFSCAFKLILFNKKKIVKIKLIFMIL